VREKNHANRHVRHGRPEKKGTDKMRKMYVRHGMAAGNAFGVSMAVLKLIAKSIKGQRALACELYEPGNLDAMYLAGMVADGSQMTKKLGGLNRPTQHSARTHIALKTKAKSAG
jgi:3-methyladenine DNA glycosylase AlkD